MLRAIVWLSAGLLVAGISGCKSSGETESQQKGPAKVRLCADCGQIKGSDLCYKEGQKTCSKCALAKSSPGCCVLPKGTTEDVELCTHCGFVRGSEKCCSGEEQTSCPKCGLIEGSPGCCRIK